MSGAEELVGALTTVAQLHIEEAKLVSPTSAKRVLSIGSEIDSAYAMAGIVRRAQRAEVSPLYFSVDDGELSGAYAQVGISAQDMALGLLDQLAERVTQESPVPLSRYGSMNWRLLLHVIGEAAIAPMMATLLAALQTNVIDHVRLERQEWPVDDEGEEIVGDGEPPLITAPIDDMPDGWEEIGFTSCAVDAEHARAILRVSIDEESLAPLFELIEQRGQAAKRVLRGEAPA